VIPSSAKYSRGVSEPLFWRAELYGFKNQAKTSLL